MRPPYPCSWLVETTQTRQKMSAMFMEDDELPGTDVGDVRSRLRAALKADQVLTVASWDTREEAA